MFRYLIGLMLLVVAFAPLCSGIWSLRRALLPSWDGPPAWLADIIAVLATIIVVTETLGTLGIYALFPATVAYAGIGAAAHIAAGRCTPTAVEPPVNATPLLGRPGKVLAAIATAFVAGTWSIRTAVGFTDGVPGADTLWYHLPAAARLVQTGSLQEIHHFDAGNLTAFYPNGSTFFHATGMLFLETDITSPLINLAWAGLALLAGWCLGRPFGVAPVTLLATAATLTFPGFVGHEAGSAMNDVTALALLLSAIALLASGDVRRITANPLVITLAAAATGAGLATKWTMLPPAGALTIGVIVLADRQSRLRISARWLAFSGLTGLFTFIRNFVLIGNPLPPVELRFGPVVLNNVGNDDLGYASVASWLFKDRAWDNVFRPGLELWFGPLWMLALALVAFGLLVGAAGRSGRVSGLAAAVGIVAVASYLFSPQFLEFLGVPAYFLSNLRYGVVGLGFGLTAIPLLPALRHGRRVWVAPILFVVLMLASATSSDLWNGFDDWRFQDRVDFGDTLVGLVVLGVSLATGLAVVRFAAANSASVRRRAVFGIGAAVLVASVVLRPAYLAERYAESPQWNPAVDLTDARVALTGLNAQFAMYGDDLSNHVQWVGDIRDHVFHPVETCDDWRRAINEGRYSHVVLGPSRVDLPGPYAWTVDDPSAVLLQAYEGDAALVFIDPEAPVPIAFFELTGPLDPDGCPT